ncbi:MAG TPA: DUF5615 family PIN-like protein [Thermoleophilaceae bacterium]|nr:DUF5615 family PIN-like protein [Thermoleophilaceae bacterium]
MSRGVRLLLDEHLSPPAIAKPLRDRGHDVRAVAEEPPLVGATDEALLALAARERRILVTCDVQDFPRIARERAQLGHDHHGCLLLAGVDHHEFGEILGMIDGALAARPDQDEWRDYVAWGARPAG